MIITSNLSKKYNGNLVLNIESLEIPKGQCFGLIGNNGAGKTTYFNLLLDLIRPTTGYIKNNNILVSECEGWKLFTSAFIDESFLISYLTAKEYFYFIGELRGQNKSDIDLFLAQFEDFFKGEIFYKKKYLRDLSKGNQKKVGIVSALVGNPKVIILDEPFTNLDPSSQIQIKQVIKDLSKKRDVSILISSHDLLHVTDVCERITVLENGKIIKDIIKNETTLKELEAYFFNHI